MAAGRALQLLTHPIWWPPARQPVQERLDRFAAERYRLLRQELGRNCVAYGRGCSANGSVGSGRVFRTMTASVCLFEVGGAGLDGAAAGAALAKDGVIVLRGLFDAAAVEDANRRIEEIARRARDCGVPGYNKVDHPKKLFSPFVVGGPLVPMMLDERVIALIEAYMESECVLAEANVKIDAPVGYEYFPMHADFTPGWQKNEDSAFVLSTEALRQPVGVGGAIYLHDTAEGAFSYCVGSHTLMAPDGVDLDAYPEPQRSEILATRVRVDGSAGDLVLFDDRGFHGPDQPSRARRCVVLLDYYRVKTFGYTQVSPMPVWSSDLGGLSARQMRVLGAGADFMISPRDYMGTRFKRNILYRPVKFLIENAFVWQHLKQKIKGAFRGRAKG